jgi:hypothetical protein
VRVLRLNLPEFCRRSAWMAFITFILALIGCDLHSNQWVLQSYDRDKGYVFTKDGVQYQATCFATGRPLPFAWGTAKSNPRY